MSCARSDELVAAARAGDLDEAGERHRALCRDCADALAIDPLLAREAAAAGREARVPPAAVVWREASRAAELARRARATRLVAWVHRAAWAGTAVVAAVVAWTFSPEAGWIGGWLAGILPQGMPAASVVPPAASGIAGGGELVPFFALAGVVLTALLLGLYGDWAEG